MQVKARKGSSAIGFQGILVHHLRDAKVSINFINPAVFEKLLNNYLIAFINETRSRIPECNEGSYQCYFSFTSQKNNRLLLVVVPACRRHGILRPENEVLRLDMFNSTRHSERTAVSGEAKNLKL